MSITFSVKMLPTHPEENSWCRGPIFLAGWLLLDESGAWLHDWDVDRRVPLCDPEAVAAIREVIPPGDYLGGALLQVWVRSGSSGLELHTAYWIQFFEPRDQARSGVDRWGANVKVRPIPEEYD